MRVHNIVAFCARPLLGEALLRPPKPHLSPVIFPRGLKHRPIAEGYEAVQPQVNPHGWEPTRDRFVLDFAGEHGVPLPRPAPRHRQGQGDLDESVLDDTHVSYLGKPQAPILNSGRACFAQNGYI